MRINRRSISILFMLALTGCASQGSDSMTSGSLPYGALVTAHDSRANCLAHIPGDATPGQRTLAEQSCPRK